MDGGSSGEGSGARESRAGRRAGQKRRRLEYEQGGDATAAGPASSNRRSRRRSAEEEDNGDTPGSSPVDGADPLVAAYLAACDVPASVPKNGAAAAVPAKTKKQASE